MKLELGIIPVKDIQFWSGVQSGEWSYLCECR